MSRLPPNIVTVDENSRRLRDLDRLLGDEEPMGAPTLPQQARGNLTDVLHARNQMVRRQAKSNVLTASEIAGLHEKFPNDPDYVRALIAEAESGNVAQNQAIRVSPTRARAERRKAKREGGRIKQATLRQAESAAKTGRFPQGARVLYNNRDLIFRGGGWEDATTGELMPISPAIGDAYVRQVQQQIGQQDPTQLAIRARQERVSAARLAALKNKKKKSRLVPVRGKPGVYLDMDDIDPVSGEPRILDLQGKLKVGTGASKTTDYTNVGGQWYRIDTKNGSESEPVAIDPPGKGEESTVSETTRVNPDTGNTERVYRVLSKDKSKKGADAYSVDDITPGGKPDIVKEGAKNYIILDVGGKQVPATLNPDGGYTHLRTKDGKEYWPKVLLQYKKAGNDKKNPALTPRLTTRAVTLPPVALPGVGKIPITDLGTTRTWIEDDGSKDGVLRTETEWDDSALVILQGQVKDFRARAADLRERGNPESADRWDAEAKRVNDWIKYTRPGKEVPPEPKPVGTPLSVLTDEELDQRVAAIESGQVTEPEAVQVVAAELAARQIENEGNYA